MLWNYDEFILFSLFYYSSLAHNSDFYHSFRWSMYWLRFVYVALVIYICFTESNQQLLQANQQIEEQLREMSEEISNLKQEINASAGKVVFQYFFIVSTDITLPTGNCPFIRSHFLCWALSTEMACIYASECTIDIRKAN